MKELAVDRHVAPLGHVILILSQLVFASTPSAVYLAEKKQITIS
jgi:hypothetical protein